MKFFYYVFSICVHFIGGYIYHIYISFSELHLMLKNFQTVI